MMYKQVKDLQDGEVFTLDGGDTWHVCAVVGFGTVSVYTDARRDDDALLVRVNAPREQWVFVASPLVAERLAEASYGKGVA